MKYTYLKSCAKILEIAVGGWLYPHPLVEMNLVNVFDISKQVG